MTEYPKDIIEKARERAEYTLSQIDACSCEECIETTTDAFAQALMEEREKAARIADDIAANTLPAATEAHQIANDIGKDTARVIAAAIRSGGE